jgi:hypothetical protein
MLSCQGQAPETVRMILNKSPLPLRDREGPIAQQWEGEVEDYLVILTLPQLRSSLTLPPGEGL